MNLGLFDITKYHLRASSFFFWIRGWIIRVLMFRGGFVSAWVRRPRWDVRFGLLSITRAKSEKAQQDSSSTRPPGYWNDEENQRQFIDTLTHDLGIADRKEEWPQLLNRKLIYEHGGSTLFGKYKGLRHLLEHLYPSIAFQFTSKPRHYWSDPANQRAFLEEEMKRRQMTHLDDWYSVDVAEFRRAGGRSLLARYPSFFAMLQGVFPEHSWDDRKRKQRPRGYWTQAENRRAFVRQRVEELGLDQVEDWSHITCSQLFGPEARRLAQYYPNYQSVLEDCYPERSVALKNKPKNYWSDLETQRAFFDSMGQELGVQELSDWNDVRTSDVLQTKQAAWVFKYYSSLADALRHIYSEVDWDELDRIRVPRHYWDDPEHARSFLAKAEAQLRIEEPEDWYRVSLQQLQELGGGGLIVRYGGLYGLLSEFYPDTQWNIHRLTMRGKRASQRWLFLEVQRMFPGEEVIEDFLYSAERESGLAIEFDVFVPSRNLALEYQGYHHYNEIAAFGSLELYQERDKEKQALATQHGISLVAVPFSWDNTQSSLRQIIHEQCPTISFPNIPATDKD